ncbi:hypothetical protein JRF84_25075 [Methylobacterium organophilum]|uniref:hypothetical protein n=1 Tax=Methylobacterium organophilum TaxID=410 RepID=UPI0019D0488D|nr:hypothetical protein [Methylobacterium organophilum]MBN6822840.1 hypothetical protein [Methylobacterium organophilum]
MTPQQIAFVGTLIGALAGLAVKLNWINKDVYDLLVSPETLQLVTVLGGAAFGAYGVYISRKHGMIETTSKLDSVDAIITKPKTAGEIKADNVVATLDEAEKVAPTIAHRAVRKTGAQPTAH